MVAGTWSNRRVASSCVASAGTCDGRGAGPTPRAGCRMLLLLMALRPALASAAGCGMARCRKGDAPWWPRGAFFSLSCAFFLAGAGGAAAAAPAGAVALVASVPAGAGAGDPSAP